MSTTAITVRRRCWSPRPLGVDLLRAVLLGVQRVVRRRAGRRAVRARAVTAADEAAAAVAARRAGRMTLLTLGRMPFAMSNDGTGAEVTARFFRLTSVERPRLRPARAPVRWPVTRPPRRARRAAADWPDPRVLDEVVAELRTLPPLVFAGECDELKERLGAVARGEAFLLQGGDCAETFADAHRRRDPRQDQDAAADGGRADLRRAGCRW